MLSATSSTANPSHLATADPFNEPIHAGKRCENLIGQKRHQLEILSFSRTEKLPGRDRLTHWNVSCTCGTVFEVSGRQFKKRTACHRCENIAKFQRSFKPTKHQKFKLVGFSHRRPTTTGAAGAYVWNCLCNCGQKFKVSSNHLIKTKNCPKCSLSKLSKQTIGRRFSSRKKNNPTPRIIKLLTECYEYTGPDLNKHRKAPTLDTISAKTGWRPSALRDLATQLGLAKTLARPLRPWTEAEVATLIRVRKATLSGIKSILQRQKSTRSRNEIRDKLLELTHLDHQDSYTFKEVLSLLGLIKHKKLRALLRPVNDPDQTKPYTRAEIRAFLLDQPDQYQLAKLDKTFFTLLILKDSFNQPARIAA
jgi:hypothetical protein